MRNVVLWAVALCLALGGCGDEKPAAPAGEEAVVPHADPAAAQAPEDTPTPAPTPDGTPIPEAGAATDADPGTDAGPAAEKGGDEEFQPPSDWCGTPTLPLSRGRVHPGTFVHVTVVLFKNKAGKVIRVDLDDLTPSKRKTLHEQGWREAGRLTEWRRVGGAK